MFRTMLHRAGSYEAKLSPRPATLPMPAGQL